MIAALEAQPAVKTYMASDGFIHWPIYGASRPVLQRTEPLEPQVSFLTSSTLRSRRLRALGGRGRRPEDGAMMRRFNRQ